MSHIISASRRTDIPRYYGAWFSQRRAAGFAEFRNAFGGHGRASLKPEDLIGYLFWTKYAQPFQEQLSALRAEELPYVFQYTITGYGADLEPNMPPLKRVLEDFCEIAEGLPSTACIQWRYDPIVISQRYDISFHRENFCHIAQALADRTRVVNTSIVEPYAKTVRRVADPLVQFRQIAPDRHKQVARRYPELLQAGEDLGHFLRELAEIAQRHGMTLRSCSNPEWNLPPSQCAGPEMFAPYGEALRAQICGLKPSPTRTACRCLKSLDIGMDNSCIAGCKYCYVVSSQESALRNFKRHDPKAVMLR